MYDDNHNYRAYHKDIGVKNDDHGCNIYNLVMQGIVMVEQYELELSALIKKAQKEPGIVDLMAVYGQYTEVLKKSQEYLAGVKPKTFVTTTAGT